MSQPIRIRVGGYAPAESTHTRAVSHFVDRMTERVGDEVSVEVIGNIMDQDRPASDLLSMVESGELTWCYFSTSYLTERVPELEQLEGPYRFENLEEAHRALDGDLGCALTTATETQTDYRVLGYWDNGFRHLTNRRKAVRRPDDLVGMRVRVQPNATHVKLIEAWGAEAVPVELSRGIDMIRSGEVDAQENPLANTVAYGVDQVHPHCTLSGHLYGARGIYAHRPSLESFPDETHQAILDSVADAITFQRSAAQSYESRIRTRLEAKGVEFVDPTPSERDEFREAAASAMT